MNQQDLMEQRARAQFIKMTQTPVPKLVLKMAVPTILSMMVTALYNLADTFFVSQLGNAPGAAVGIVFSLMNIIQAFAFAVGMGAGSLISRKLGEQDRAAANKFAVSAFYMGAAIGVIIMIIGLTFLDGLMIAIGSTETILPFARDYGFYIFFGAPFMCMSVVLNNVLRAEGKSNLASIGLMSGTILNVILDPIFIFTLDMKVGGAAIATLLGQGIGFLILVVFFICRKSQISLNPKHMSRKFRDYLEIWKVGLPGLCRQGLSSVANVSLNVNAAAYGDAAVAAVTIVGRVFMMVFSVMLGMGQGLQPVAGYNYGAKLYKRVREAFWFTLFAGFCLMLGLSLLGFFLSEPLMRAFRDDETVIEIGALMMRIQCFGTLIMAPITSSTMLFQALGKPGRSIFLSTCRQGIFFLPLIYLLPRYIGLLGVQIAQPVSDALTAIVSLSVVLPFLHHLKKLEKSTAIQNS